MTLANGVSMPEIKVPLLDLKAQYQGMAEEINERLKSVVESQCFILGPEVEALEKEISAFFGAKHAIGVASGTDALILSLKALGVGPGDEVITTPFSFYATASCIVHAGARPVFADIDPDTCLISPETVRSAVGERTKAVIPVHLFGQCAEMDALSRIAEEHGLKILEDACQAAGAEYRGRRAGAMGDAGALSFYPSKNLGGFGDGGMALTNGDETAGRIRTLRVHGASREYHHETIGYNSRLDEIQAAVLRVKLSRLEKWNQARRENAARYDRAFQDGPVKPLNRVPGSVHVFNNYVVRAPERDRLMDRLKKRGVGCAVYYPAPLHRMECFWGPEGKKPSLPGADQASRECLAIPVHPELTREMQDHVIESILEFYS